MRQLAASPGVADVIPDSPIAGPDPADLSAASMQFLSGSQLIALPYSYRIG